MLNDDPTPHGDPEAADPRATVENGDAPETNPGKRPDLRSLAGGASVADRHAAGEGNEPPQTEEELFPLGSLTGDSKFSILSIFKKSHKFRVKAKMKAVKIPVTGDGMLAIEGETVSAVQTRFSRIIAVPEYNEQGKIVAWDITQEFLPVHVDAMPAAGDAPAAATG